jgi:hypothetical protein
MANLITTALTYSKEDSMNYFITPLFVQNSALQYFDVLMNIRSNTKLQRFTQIEKITKAYVKGFNGSTGSVLDQRAINVARVEAEVEQEADTFFNTIMGELLKLGTAKDDLSDTELMRIIAEIMMKAVSRDFERMIWLGDTAGAADYNPYDGIFKNLAGLPAGQKLVFPAGAIAVDGAIAQFELVKAAAPNELRENRANTKIFVSQSVADNYRESLRSGGTEQAFTNMQGGTPTLTWDGFEIVEMANWDTHISADALATDVHRIVMTDVSNIVIGTDIDSNNGADFWYDKTDQCNRFRLGYVAGTQYRTDELTVTNIAA